MKDYQEKSYDCQLFEDVYETLRKAHFFGFPQCILSASRKDYLLKQIEKFDILDYVDSVHGIENIYASSKKELARKYVFIGSAEYSRRHNNANAPYGFASANNFPVFSPAKYP